MTTKATATAAAAWAGKRVAVTGGAGFIGSTLVEALLGAGAHVRVIDNFFSGKEDNLLFVLENGWEERFELYVDDIFDYEAMISGLADCEAVFHLAALGSVPLSVEDPQLANDINVTGSLNILHAAKLNGIKRVVVSSSSAVYGDDPALPKHEAMTPQPESPYATAKLAMEGYARNFTKLYDMDVAVLRYFNVFGPRQDPQSQYAAVIPLFVSRLLAQKDATIFGDGEQTRDFVHVDDVVRANLLASTAEHAVMGEPINIAGGAGISVNHLYNKIAQLLDIERKPVHAPARKGDILHSVADVSRATQRLGFGAELSVDAGLVRSIDWYRNNLG